ncbi:phosphoacetylglucosamine mutase isoform X1 [Camellia sinensis]|uniref:phosphoacetylglucosamine mutase isoform X1 n=1 Tax=Camellia sinensis TaxID=4442 RepID=UPI0010364F1D|nr:phosphoacetylglucosamine mutase isoform X1 [Camellia sinensis]
MNEKQRSIILSSSSRFPPPPGVKLSYGTAGFRADSLLLESTVFRVGILAALRSVNTHSVIGLMITASHNKVSDNGIKISDPSGGMLSQDWEPFADALANAPDSQHLAQLIDDFVKKENIPLEEAESAEILLGRDTRPSGESLLDAAKQGIISIVGAVAVDMGVLTTPQLHWMVRARNKAMKATELDYFNQLSSSFRCLIDLIPQGSAVNKMNDNVVVDGANGVGGEKLEVLKKILNGLDMEIRNSGKEGVLNEGVGADYVQKEKVAPRGFCPADAGIRCASLDGDADRLVYFSVLSNANNKIDLVDGDKILSLFALFIKEQLSTLNKNEGDKENKCYRPTLGVVQTAYANGASTDYLKQSGLEVMFTPTGVKYLHEKAAEYDIGIYFEANGHGTILFSEGFLHWLDGRNIELALTLKGSEQHKAAMRLLAVSKLINQAVGDALSGLLLVEAILKHMGWSIHRWNELYHDLPSKQLKVKVVDRSVIVTEKAETVVVWPLGIQEAINIETAKYPRGRCFVRPSGTEDVVRVYAEATTEEAADNLASSIARLVDQFLGFGSS